MTARVSGSVRVIGRGGEENPDSVTGARNRSAEIENLWLDVKACGEDSE